MASRLPDSSAVARLAALRMLEEERQKAQIAQQLVTALQQVAQQQQSANNNPFPSLLQQQQQQNLQALASISSLLNRNNNVNLLNQLSTAPALDPILAQLLLQGTHADPPSTSLMSPPTPLSHSASPTSILDNATASDQAAVAILSRKRKGRSGTFPQKLHQMLSDLEAQPDLADIASFLPHGRAFCIHKPRDFCKHIMPKYFRMSRFSSFQRQLNLYEFHRINEGPDKGAYAHELFQKGRPILSTMMKRNKIKGVKKQQQHTTTTAVVHDSSSSPDDSGSEA